MPGETDTRAPQTTTTQKGKDERQALEKDYLDVLSEQATDEESNEEEM